MNIPGKNGGLVKQLDHGAINYVPLKAETERKGN